MFRYLIIASLVLSGCKQVYDPEVDTDVSAIVVEGILTDIPGQTMVKISKTIPYDSTDNRIPVSGVHVSIIDDLGQISPMFEVESGVYMEPELVAAEGRSYFLKVETNDGYIYQSALQSLPRSFKQDTIYAESLVKTELVPNFYGRYVENQVEGIETYVDLNSSDLVLPKCRYDVNVTVLYSYTVMGGIPVTFYGWRTFNPNKFINVTSSKFEKSMGVISKHPIGFFSRNARSYVDSENAVISGFLIAINRYSVNNETHRYFMDIVSQLEAKGKIFDPMPAQLLGNIKCVNESEKLVFGYFEVSRLEKLYYRVMGGNEGIKIIPKDKFPEFSPTGLTTGNPPAFYYY